MMAGAGLRALVFALLAQPPFVDLRIPFRNQSSPTAEKYLLESMTGGVAMLDYDGDGLLDLFFVNGAALSPGEEPDKSEPRFWNRLYRNQGNGAFSDVTEKAGVAGHSYGMGAAAGDFDNDGDTDLYVTNYGSNILYRNNGDGTFTDVAKAAGVEGGGWSTGSAFVDYDADGFLDLLVARYLDWNFERGAKWCGARKPGHRSYCHPDEFPPATHLLYRNNGDGTFRDVSRESGIGSAPGKGLGVAFHDYDRDGRLDLLIANDSFPQQLFRNLGNGRFEELALPSGLAYNDDGQTFAGMGVDFQDYDNDGWPDVVINALANQRYALFRNQKGMFEYHSGPSGVAGITMLRSGWGMRFFDHDNDGWKDLLVGQGHVMDNIELTQPGLRYLEPLLLMRNERGRFVDAAAFQTPLAARGVAFGDLDNDGWVDAAVNCNNRPAVLLRNQGGTGNHWLMVKTVGVRGNRDGMGARIRMVPETGPVQHGIVTTAGSYLSASDKRVHFGLGAARRVKLLEITWPGGAVQRLEGVEAGRILTVEEPANP